MIETPVVRKRKASHQPVKMEDIKIEYVDLCVFPTHSPAIIVEQDPLANHMEYSTIDENSIMGGGSIAGDSGCDEGGDEGMSSGGGGNGQKAPRKRRKLDHLSAEEKSQHRKMMNRMSAQSARDRQKALMQQQDAKIKALQQVNETLKKQNVILSSKNEELKTENVGLKQQNSRLAQLVRELQQKLGAVQTVTSSQIVKQEVTPMVVEEDAVVVCDSVIGGGVVDSEQNVSVGLVGDGSGFNNSSSSSKPAVLRTIPLQKGPKEELLFPLSSPQSSNKEQDVRLLATPKLVTLEQQLSNKSKQHQPAAMLLLLMSYLGIWTHLKFCKSSENSQSKLLEEIGKSEKSSSKLTELLENLLQQTKLPHQNHNPVKMEPTTPG